MKIRMFNFYEISFIILFLVVISFSAHFILIDRIGFWRIIYPLQAKLADWSIKCNKDSPIWMTESLKYIIKNQKNLTNQIAYVDVNDNVHTCQSGWQGTSFFSKNLTEDSRFRYASLTKLLTSDAILQEINNGKIKLSTKIVDIVPEIKKNKLKDSRIEQITISHLLEHRSGFDRMQSEDVIFSLEKKSWCPYDLSELSSIKLDFDPGERYAYDNRNYCVLGVVLEHLEKLTYRQHIEQKYSLSDKNIKFVDGYYYPDEVKYDFRNNNFWMESHDNKFDFNALSSSAGLSGSAKQLTILISKMLKSKPYNILSIAQPTLENCEIEAFKSCNGYGMWQYRQSQNKPIMYFRNGGLPAVTSLAMVTDKHEVVVWIGNGATLYDTQNDENLLEKYFYKILNRD